MRDTIFTILRLLLHRTATSRIPRHALLASVIAASAVVAPVSAVSAQTGDGDLSPVEVVRYGGADRYETSLLVAEAVAADAGGQLDHVVLVSGRHWHDAVVAAGVAGRVGGPVLMTPPDGLGEDALEFLGRVGATQVTVVTTGAWPDTSVSPSVFTALEEAGLTVGRLGGDDRYATGVSVAEWMVEAQSQEVSGKIAIVANGEVFADALVAGPLSARRLIPVLLTERDELHSAVAGFLGDAGIERVVLMGGTAALSAGVESAIADLGISVDRMAGATRFETAILTGRFAAELVGGGCFDSGSVGLARARVPFDSFSAAPLMARRCAPLVLTDPEKVPASTSAFLNDTRSTTDDKVLLTVFGGNAAVSQAAVEAFLDLETPQDEDHEGADPAEPALSCGADSADPPSQLISGSTFAREPVWSPDCNKIAYVDVGALTIADVDGANATAVLRLPGMVLNNPGWSPDGTRIVLSVFSFDGGRGYEHQRRHIYVVNADGTDATKITDGIVEDDYPSWSPDGTRIVFQRTTWQDRTVSPPVGNDRYIVTMDPDGANQAELNKGGGWESHPAWSPDGTLLALDTGLRLGLMNPDGTNLRSWDVAMHWFSKLSWSPDGTRIAMARFAGPRDDPSNVEANIAIFEVATGSVTDITTAEGTELNPHWSPDGNRIVFNTRADGGRDTRVWVVGAQHRTG
ncbi:cell wall-binding repeat-containing protein [Candidatus Poriferisodalis sp.]|uniref:cell wall-binding repeat-containing protein n=1 Tax=Candidatus Poriferisodalis sp. TaxID=3101277 RepID=UPI003B521E65